MSAGEPRTVLFVCRHGAAKSVLAAAELRTLATDRRLRIGAEAAGLEPSADVSPAVVEALAEGGTEVNGLKPRRVSKSDIESAWRVITFNLEPSELPAVGSNVERWDDVPATSEDLEAARAVIGRHLERLVEALEA